MSELEIENIQSVAETYSLILTFELEEVWNSFSAIEQCWSLKLRSAGVEMLSQFDRDKLDRVIADKMSTILSSDDAKLLAELKAIRTSWLNNILSQSSKLLDETQQSKLKKMVILQNIATGNKPSQQPWKAKTKKSPPKRAEFTEKLLAKV